MSIDRDSATATIEYMKSAKTDALKRKHEILLRPNLKLTIKWLNDGIFQLYWRAECNKLNTPITLRQPPPQNSPQNIQNLLSDQNLLAIFSASTLSALDLFEIGNVCSRFKRLAKAVFQTKYADSDDFYKTIIPQPLWRLEKFFELFGSSVLAFNCVPSFESIDNICGIVSEHCTNIVRLHCSVEEQQTYDNDAMRALISRLKAVRLEIYPTRSNNSLESYQMDLRRLFDASCSIERLYINGFMSRLLLPRKNLPNLISVKIVCFTLLENRENDSFFTHNPQIQSLALVNFYLDFGIEHILNHMPNINELRIAYFIGSIICGDFQCFSRLKCLQKLYLRDDSEPINVKRILQIVSLHRLPIENLIVQGIQSYDEQIVDSIVKIHTIKQLDFADAHQDSELICIAESLAELEEIEITSYSDAPMLIGIRKLLEIGGAKLKKITYKYKVHPEHKNIPLSDSELANISTTVQNRGIEMKFIIYRDDNTVSKQYFLSVLLEFMENFPIFMQVFPFSSFFSHLRFPSFYRRTFLSYFGTFFKRLFTSLLFPSNSPYSTWSRTPTTISKQLVRNFLSKDLKNLL